MPPASPASVVKTLESRDPCVDPPGEAFAPRNARVPPSSVPTTPAAHSGTSAAPPATPSTPPRPAHRKSSATQSGVPASPLASPPLHPRAAMTIAEKLAQIEAALRAATTTATAPSTPTRTPAHTPASSAPPSPATSRAPSPSLKKKSTRCTRCKTFLRHGGDMCATCCTGLSLAHALDDALTARLAEISVSSERRLAHPAAADDDDPEHI